MSLEHRQLAHALESGNFEVFRAGLLTHIAIEERLLMPVLARAGRFPELLAVLRAEHAVLAAMTVPSPRADLVFQIRRILELHDLLEEGESGLYAKCVQLAAGDAATLLEQIEGFRPAVPSPHRDGAAIERHIAKSLELAALARGKIT
jgi:hypothetical protein